MFTYLWNSFSNWWWPQAEQCGNLFAQLGIADNTPEGIKHLFCYLEEKTGLSGLELLLVGGGLVTTETIRRGGPRYVWDKIRRKPVSEHIIDAVQASLAYKLGIRYAPLLQLIQRKLDTILPDVTDAKKQKMREEAIAKLSGKLQKAQFASAFDKPENQAKIESDIRQNLIGATVSYVTTYGEEFSNASLERQRQIVEGIQDWYLENKLPPPRTHSVVNTDSDEITPVTSTSTKNKIF